MGAIGEGGFEYVDRRLVARIGLAEDEVRAVAARERQVLEARVTRLRRGRDRQDLSGRVAVVVDDGIATGATARVACDVARHLGAAEVVLAVPVAPRDTLEDLLAADAGPDEVVCIETPAPFWAVGHHYRDFSPVSDEAVVALLDDAAGRARAGSTRGRDDCDLEVEVPAGTVTLPGHLHLPDRTTTGLVVFAHGSGSSRHSPRNRYVASVLHEAGLGTLLLDLLTPDEEHDRSLVFDVTLLAARLSAAVRWVADRPDTVGARIGVFGASTGAAAALWAASDPGLGIRAVVSRGGRPDLAGPRLGLVTSPTLLVVGGRDLVVLDLNRAARARLRCPNQLVVVPGATHLFEEPGTLAEAAIAARDWFREHLLGDAATPTAPPTAP
jgi:putative phosphoribosyl transferase